MAIFDEKKMSVGNSENLVTLHLYEITQPWDKEILGGWQILGRALTFQPLTT